MVAMNWSNQSYRDFMIKMVSYLEPRYEPAGTIIFQELEEVNEILFIDRGVVDVGYEINKERKFCIRHSHHVVIGAYNVTFNKRAVFVYRCKRDCHGYFIRRENWHDCLDVDDYIKETIKSNVKEQY